MPFLGPTLERGCVGDGEPDIVFLHQYACTARSEPEWSDLSVTLTGRSTTTTGSVSAIRVGSARRMEVNFAWAAKKIHSVGICDLAYP